MAPGLFQQTPGNGELLLQLWLLLTFEESCGTLGVTERWWGIVSLVFTPPIKPRANGALGKPAPCEA